MKRKLGLCRFRFLLGLYWDNGKEHGNSFLGFPRPDQATLGLGFRGLGFRGLEVYRCGVEGLGV